MPNNYSDSTASGFDEFAEEEGIDLRHYWRVILRNKWGILGLVFAVGLFTIVWAYSLQPVYRSTATLLIGGNEAVTESNTQSLLVQGNFLGTQYELLKSRKVAQRVLEQLKTDRDAILAITEADSEPGFDWRGWVPQSWQQLADPVQPPIAESDPDKVFLDWLSHGLQVAPVRDTSIVQVSFEATEPKLAARVANAYTSAYLDYNLKQRVESTTEASLWLEEQLAKAEEHVMKSADILRQYREEVGLVDVEGMKNVQTGLLKDRSASLSAARRARGEAEGLYLRAERLQKERQMDNIPEVLENRRIQRLRDQEEVLERQIRIDSERYQGNYPGLDDSRSNLKALREQINEALNKLVEGFKTDFEIARANEWRLEREVKALEDSIQKLGHKQVEVNALEHTVETNRQAYDAFLNQLMETRTRSADTVTMIARVLDLAEPVFSPVKPNKPRMLMISLILALVVGIGIAMVVDKLDNTLKSREDVQERLGVPVLGELIMLKGKQAKGVPFAPHRQFLDEPTSSFAESIRTIRTGVVLSSLDQPHQTLVVTSTVNREGKSTVAYNLALALGQLGKVLLIDADLRNPSLANLYGLDSETPGLTDLVAGTVTLAECIRKIPEDIHVLFAGSTVPPDPLKILSSERFSKLLQEAAATYDTVVIDSAPVELVSDARVLATRATGVVYVVKADETAHQVVRHGLSALIDTGTTLLGVVLNQINPDQAHAYGKFKYGYSRYGNYSHNSYGHAPRSPDSPTDIRKVG
ncbi:MAG: polysaccharide biosynthesis tyrosine autokinase [Gammaproteobacteria bacterium]